MQELSVEAGALAAYAGVAGQMATQLADATAQATAATPALLGPVFGIIGADFVATFAAVHTQHVAAIAKLTETVAAIGVTAAGNEATYAGVDEAVGDAVSAAGTSRLV